MDEIAPRKVHSFYSIISILGVIGAVLIVFGWMGKQWYDNSRLIISPNPNAPVPRSQQVSVAGLGAEIYEQIKNPVQDRLPDTAPQVTNPITQVYKNPFE